MAGPIRIAILANGRQARREINSVNTALGGLGRLAKGGLAVAGLTSLTYAVGGFVKSAVDAEAKFSTTMRLIAAATKAPARDMERLNDLAIKLGQDTAFSASEAAGAMLELAKAGIDTRTIMQGGLSGTLQLAAAGGTELGTAATIASNALNTFNLRGRDMASVAAALAGGANASSASVESLGQALQQVGPGATNAGLSLQETVAALSAFDAAGIKGSDAGTSLKTMLTRLVPMTEKASKEAKRLGLDFTTANGEFLSMTGIAQELQRELSGLTREERTKALATIFGSDATRAATVLMKEGAAGIREFIKATNDQNAAQKMAEARMSGTAGALERLNGTVETAKLRLGQELAPLIERGADGLAKNLVPAMDSVISGAKELADAVSPAFREVKEAISDLIPDASDVGEVFDDQVIPAIRALSGLVADAVGLWNDLPGPLREVALQAGAAAFVLPRLTGAVGAATGAVTTNIARLQQWRAEMTYAETRTQNLTALTNRLGTAARTAAGIGGMLALAQSAQASSQALSVLGNAAGGALLGFSVGGPWGAAVGAGSGALLGLWQSTRKASGAMDAGKVAAQQYADSINAIANASGRARREEALTLLQREGMIPIANQLGISTRQLVAATLGNQKAQAKVRDAYYSTTNVLEGLQAQKLNEWLTEQGWALRQARTEIEKNEQALRRFGGANKALPKDVQRVSEALRQAGNVKPNMGKFQAFFRSSLDKTASDAQTRSQKINDLLLSTTSKARANLTPFRLDLLRGLSQAQGPARTGGMQIGDAMQAGVVAGFSGTAAQLAALARSAVVNAIGNARKAGDIHSPSRKMQRIGEQLGDGLALGLLNSQAKVGKAGRDLTGEAMVAAYATSRRTEGSARSTATHVFPRELTLVVEDGRSFRAYVRDVSNGEARADRSFDRGHRRGYGDG